MPVAHEATIDAGNTSRQTAAIHLADNPLTVNAPSAIVAASTDVGTAGIDASGADVSFSASAAVTASTYSARSITIGTGTVVLDAETSAQDLTVTVGSGTLSLNGGSSPAGSSGRFSSGPEGTLRFAAGTFGLGDGSVLSGTGQLVWNDGALGSAGGGTLGFGGGAGLATGGSGARVLEGLSVTVADLSLAAGSLELRSSTLTDPGSVGPSISAGASLLLSGNGATLANVAPLMLDGTLAGTGTVTGDVGNATGTVSPGASPGRLTIAGDYVQGPAGTLLAEIAGSVQGVTYDWLEVLGTATLDGTLHATQLAGFAPALGNAFDVLTYTAPLVGDFATILLPGGYASLGDQGALYRLTVASVPVVPPTTPPPAPPPDAGDETPPAALAQVILLNELSFTTTPFIGDADDDERRKSLRECR